jgi:predicted nicotinamide N-methyase
MTDDDFADLLARHTVSSSPPICPEIRTREARELVPIWEAAEKLASAEVEPPFWAYSWAGSQALARYLLDHPDTVRQKVVLDLGSGNGLAAVAAAKAGARRVVANDVDPHALRMVAMNARENGVAWSPGFAPRGRVGRSSSWAIPAARTFPGAGCGLSPRTTSPCRPKSRA